MTPWLESKNACWFLGKFTESTSGVAKSSTVPNVFGHSGDYVSVGNRSVSNWWRMARPSSNDGDDGSGQRVWKKRRALRHFAFVKVADEELMEKISLTLWDNVNASKDRASRKKVGDLGKNVDDQGASCLVGPRASSLLAGVDGRVVSRPAVKSVFESGSKESSARYTNRFDASLKRIGNSDGATQLLPLSEKALVAVETRARATSERKGHGATVVLEVLREEAQMAVESGRGAISAKMALESLREDALTKVGASGGLGGQNLSNRQEVFFLFVWIPWAKNIRILIRST